MRHDGGIAHNIAASGRPRTSSGAAMIINTSCCAMCAEKRMLPRASSGETSAITSAIHPPKKAITCSARV